MNRHQAYHRVTAIELVHGKQYTGSIVPFGCPVYAFVRSQALSPPKGDPKWKMTIFLGRTDGQAVWIVSDGERIMRTRRVRRVDIDSCLVHVIFLSIVGISDRAYEEGSRSPSIEEWANATFGSQS